jgi:hypothetical protein
MLLIRKIFNKLYAVLQLGEYANSNPLEHVEQYSETRFEKTRSKRYYY